MAMLQRLRQRRLEQFAAQLITRQPNGFKHRQYFHRIVDDFRTAPLGRGGAQRMIQQPQR